MLACCAHLLDLLRHLRRIAADKCLFTRLRKALKECAPSGNARIFQTLQVRCKLALSARFAKPLHLLFKLFGAIGKLKTCHGIFKCHAIPIHRLGCCDQLIALRAGDVSKACLLQIKAHLRFARRRNAVLKVLHMLDLKGKLCSFAV